MRKRDNSKLELDNMAVLLSCGIACLLVLVLMRMSPTLASAVALLVLE
jgi:hypothetical protein